MRLLTKREIQNTKALLFTIASGLLKNEYRRRGRTPEQVSWEQLVGDGERLDHLPQFQTYDFDDAHFTDGFDRAVRDLDDDPRSAFILGELRGLTSREAGAYLGTSHETARARRDLAAATIQKELTAQ